MSFLEASSTFNELKKIFHHRKYKGILIDLNALFGVFLTVLLAIYYIQLHTDGLQILQDAAKVVAGHLEVLIDQLMHNPVGLKLNEPLSKALGGFFLYHIRLWRLYIISVQSLMSALLIGFCFLGLFGASALTAGVSDLLSFVTLHCYVFYVYAARLFNLNVVSVISLWRMFRGKKYNPIRECVDSGHFGSDQIIVGMLFFMIAGFMLPTTAVYYFVFLSLRLVLKGALLLLNLCQEKLRCASPVIYRYKSRKPHPEDDVSPEPTTGVGIILQLLGKILLGQFI